MRFRDLPKKYKQMALDHLYELKLQECHHGCAHKSTQHRRGAYSSWEQDRNCDTVKLISLDGYCKHGAWVGGCGADYMCGMCENGTTDYEWALGIAFGAYNRAKRKENKKKGEELLTFFETTTYDRNNPEHKARLDRALVLVSGRDA